MLFEEGLCDLEILRDFELADIWLRPEEGESSSNLSVGVYLGLRTLLSDHDLLELDKVGNESIFVDATVEESGTTSFSAPPGDQD